MTTKIVHGLNKLKKDNRDFSVAGFFGQIPLSEVSSTTFVVDTPLVIKDQRNEDYCSSYAVTAVSEDQEEVELLPEYQFGKTKLLSGDPEEWGANLRDACKSAVKFGSLPVIGYEQYRRIPRERVVDPETWTEEMDNEAKKYRKATFFKVDGQYDVFDNIRTAMWQFRDEKRSIVVGAEWKHEWTAVPDGIIPKVPIVHEGYGHAFKIFGQDIKNGELHLIAQLSNSTEIGDKGLFYFPREVVNREFAPYGQFMFMDIPKEKVAAYIALSTPWYIKIINKLLNF